MDPLSIVVLYILLGFGLRGGFPHWNQFVRAIFALAFPLHELLFRIWNSHFVQSLFRSQTFWGWIVATATFLALAALSELGTH